MGFGPLFVGFAFLFDFQLGLRHPGEETAYAMLDIFPDVIGWLLIFWGLARLAKKAEEFAFLRNSALFFLVLSLFTLAKDTVFFSAFYTENVQCFAGEAVDFCVHLLELGFIALLARRCAALCRKKGEDKIALSHAALPGIALCEGILFAIARSSRFLSLPAGALSVVRVVSMLDYVFLVFLVWFGAIALFRTMLRVTE